MSDHEDLHEVDVCRECGAVEQGHANGRCNVCGEEDPNYDGPPDGAWPGSVDPDEQRHQMDEARRLKR